MPQSAAVTVAGHTIRMTNLDRVMYPETGMTKAEVMQYLLAVALPLGRQVRDRILTRKRWPHGVAEESFFEKNLPAGAPEWIDRVPVGAEPVTYPVLRHGDPQAPLVWFAQLGVLEFHVPQWRLAGSTPTAPDRIVIDLDPGPPAGLVECREVALRVREVLDGLALPCQPVLSGSKGMQLYVAIPPEGPLAGADSAAASEFARTLAVSLEEADPDLVVSRMTRSLRPGRVFLDWSQNNGAKTTIAPYSLRGTPEPHVAAPLGWDEVEAGDLRQQSPDEALARLAVRGDPFA